MEVRMRIKREYIMLFKEWEVDILLGLLGLIDGHAFDLSTAERKLISALTSELRLVTTLED